MKKHIPLFLFLLVMLLGLVLRLWHLGSVPPSPDWDEAALGYNAYSILHTGKDEYGQFLPIVLRSFDDYKPALYAYLTIPSVAVFGLNVFAVRLPAALIGVLAVYATFVFIKELCNNEKLGLTAAFLLAISPWHIQFTRIAFEAGVGMALNLFAAVFFLKGLKKPWLLFLSVMFISMGIYVYQSEKVFAPLLFLLLIGVYWKQLIRLQKSFIVGGIILGLLLTLPMGIYTITNKNALARAQGVSFFADQTSFLKTDATRLAVDHKNNDFIGLVLDNRRIVIGKTMIANYLSHFDLNWLFITGDIARHHAPGMGLLYLWELPFLCIGIYQVFFGNYEKKTKILLLGWFLLVPIPASITTGVPHAVRTLNFLPLFPITVAIGLFTSFAFLRTRKQVVFNTYGRIIFLIVLITFGILNISYYLDQYFVQQNYFNSIDWQYGYAKAIPFVQQLTGKYKKIVVDNQPYMDQSYIFFLFYLQYPPEQYQKESQFTSGGFRENHAFGKFEFRPIEWNKEQKSEDTLYIGRYEDFPTGVDKLYQVNFINDVPAILVVQG